MLILKWQCHEIFCHFFYLGIEFIWAPDKQAKMVCSKIRFRGDIREKFDLRSVSLHGVRLCAG